MNKLTNKQRVFIAEYIKDFNASRAARVSGYSLNNAQQIGSKLLHMPAVKAAIEQAISERIMAADEVRLRLADIARGDMGNFMSITSVSFGLDLQAAQEQGLTKLIKKVKQTTVTTEDAERNTIEIELYDAQAALTTIGKHLGLFRDQVDVQLNAPGLEDVLRAVYDSDAGGDGDGQEAA